MLPSIGYFSGIPCVFYSDGDCARPHCHFRHSDQVAVEGIATQHETIPGPKQNHHVSHTPTPNSWTPAQISMVTKLVQNAVDKALQGAVGKPDIPPREALVRNTLDKLLADPEALKMANRRTSRQAQQLPTYEPTPISKLTHKHIPVSCVPEKPYTSLARSRAHSSSSSTEITPNWHSRPTVGSKQQVILPSHNPDKVDDVTTNSPIPTSEIPPRGMNGQDQSPPKGFYKNTKPHEACQLKNVILRCSIPLKILKKSELPEYKYNTQDQIPIEENIEGKTETLKKIPKIISRRQMPGMDHTDCEPPMKKKFGLRSETPNLHVSSSEDPFTRWMNNEKIRRILKKDNNNRKPKQDVLSQAPKRVQKPEKSKKLEEEMPEPKVPKRVAHKIDRFRPIPISAENVKIPSALRHHFCNAFFDEFKKTMTPEEAKVKASEEELQVAKNSKTTKTYKNNCTLLIVKFRKGNIGEGKRQVQPDLTPGSCPDFTYGWSMYQAFSAYLLKEDELRENGFPLALRDNCAYLDKASMRYSVQQPEKPHHKICAHCSKEFVVDENGMPTTKDDCFYHWGKLRKVLYKGQKEDKFTCCGGSLESSTCESAVYHVWSGNDADCMEGYMETKKLPAHMDDHEAGIYALDCEMCYTTKGLELARLTVLNLNSRVVFDEVIALKSPVLNYCTRFSGIDAHKMASATHTFVDVRHWIMEHFYDKTILIGHSLENDLKALKLIHRTIVDTSVTFPHKFGPPNKMSLKHLAAVVLQINIQDNIDGHDSKEDAATCLQLMMKKILEDSKARKPRVIIGYNTSGEVSTATTYMVPEDKQSVIGVVGFSEAWTTPGQAFAIEAVITAVLLLVVCAVTDPNRTDLANSAPVAIGLAIACSHIFAVPYTGSAMNPARAFGPAAMVGNKAWDYHWIYWVAPIVGGAAAGLAYRFLFRAPKDDDSSYDL